VIDTRPTPRKPSGDLIADYIAHYAARINRHIQDNVCALLVGPLGCGKSAVLEPTSTWRRDSPRCDRVISCLRS
jgi:ABC-type lipoprotein export system ATPase subunit